MLIRTNYNIEPSPEKCRQTDKIKVKNNPKIYTINATEYKKIV